MLSYFVECNCFVEQGLGLRSAVKSQPVLIVHSGKCIPVCGPLIASFQNAGFLIIVH